MTVTIISSGSPIATISTQSNAWWLKVPGQPSMALEIDVVGDSLGLSSSEAQSKHVVLGADYSNVIGDSIKGEEFTLTIDFLDDASYQAFEAIRRLQTTVLLQAPWNQQWYVRLGAERQAAVVNVADMYRQVSMPVIEQAMP